MRNFVGLCVARAIAQSFSPHRRVRLEHLGQEVESRVAFVPSESSLDLFESSRCSKYLCSIKIDATIPALHELNPTVERSPGHNAIRPHNILCTTPHTRVELA